MVSWAIPHEHEQWLGQGTEGVTVEPCPAMDAARAYLERPQLDWAIVLASQKRGSGKSFAAAWLMTRLLELYETARAVGAAKLRAGSGRAMWCDCGALGRLAALKPWERDAELAILGSCWLVVLDDIGTEDDPGKVSTVLSRRHAGGLVTICTTNLSDAKGQPTEAWRKRYGGRIASRLKVDGDHERGGRRAWCYCPTVDMRGRVTPTLLTATSSRQTEVPIDFDALAGPLLHSTDPARLDERAEVTREESAMFADVARRKLWGSLALQVLSELAEQDNAGALDALDTIARRANGG